MHALQPKSATTIKMTRYYNPANTPNQKTASAHSNPRRCQRVAGSKSAVGSGGSAGLLPGKGHASFGSMPSLPKMSGAL